MFPHDIVWRGVFFVKLAITPDPWPLDPDADLVVVVAACANPPPVIHHEEGAPKPDRHYLLGLAQTALFLMEEMDPDCAAVVDSMHATIIRDGEHTHFSPEFVITVDKSGRIHVIGVGSPADARREARKALRYFTGGVRLDVP